MAFFFRTRAKVRELPPLHRDLVLEKWLSVRLPPAEWEQFMASIARHDEVTGGKAKYALHPAVGAVVTPLIRILCTDAAPGSTVGIAFDGRGPEGRYGAAQPAPDVGIRRKVTQQFAAYPMLRADADLADGSALHLQVTERSRFTKWRQTRHSKTKFKRKTKTTMRYTVRLTLPKDVTPQQPPTPTPSWLRTTVTQKKRFIITSQLKGSEHMRLDALLDVITECFRWTAHTNPQEAIR